MEAAGADNSIEAPEAVAAYTSGYQPQLLELAERRRHPVRYMLKGLC